MKNKLIDLNNHLFAQLERLSDESLSAEEITKEAARAEAVVGVSDQIVKAASVQLKMAELVANFGGKVTPHLPMIEQKPAAPAPAQLTGTPK